jgi:hypothetical protein
MEHRGCLVIGLLGFGSVAYVALKLASRIDTHPDLEHFKPPPTRTPEIVREGPPPTPTMDAAEMQRVADRQHAARDLLINVAASQYVDQARLQLKGSRSWVSDDIPCAPSTNGPPKGRFANSRPPPEGVLAWTATVRCMDEKNGYEVTFPVNLVLEGGRWEIDGSTQNVLSRAGYFNVEIREMTESEFDVARKPAPLPPIFSSGRSGF